MARRFCQPPESVAGVAVGIGEAAAAERHADARWRAPRRRARRRRAPSSSSSATVRSRRELRDAAARRRAASAGAARPCRRRAPRGRRGRAAASTCRCRSGRRARCGRRRGCRTTGRRRAAPRRTPCDLLTAEEKAPYGRITPRRARACPAACRAPREPIAASLLHRSRHVQRVEHRAEMPPIGRLDANDSRRNPAARLRRVRRAVPLDEEGHERAGTVSGDEDVRPANDLAPRARAMAFDDGRLVEALACAASSAALDVRAAHMTSVGVVTLASSRANAPGGSAGAGAITSRKTRSPSPAIAFCVPRSGWCPPKSARTPERRSRSATAESNTRLPSRRWSSVAGTARALEVPAPLRTPCRGGVSRRVACRRRPPAAPAPRARPPRRPRRPRRRRSARRRARRSGARGRATAARRGSARADRAPAGRTSGRGRRRGRPATAPRRRHHAEVVGQLVGVGPERQQVARRLDRGEAGARHVQRARAVEERDAGAHRGLELDHLRRGRVVRDRPACGSRSAAARRRRRWRRARAPARRRSTHRVLVLK